ncbi:hypothetical protein [Devosia sp. SD17-2]|jgi:hypothetical protein|uniref:hypothetical protein n=1 Tax=Devosia sp. SD17-2 TaxID=2976459 RepID=UPI0023D838A5|nr:hypothetical protein [Devosia sp. SD17-2]WEJ32742.1 hypothetical protein NYQ88_17955 [Devosia sp. SD17-2]
MKIVDRTTFLHLKTPVVFARVDKCDNIGPIEIANEMLIFDEPIGGNAGDFYTISLDDYSAHVDGMAWIAMSLAHLIKPDCALERVCHCKIAATATDFSIKNSGSSSMS